jgi:ketosteroid isomerase-like protein
MSFTGLREDDAVVSYERARSRSALAYGSRSTAAATTSACSYTTSGDATGVEGVRRSFDELYEGFHELGFDADEFYETGDTVVVIGHMYARGRSTGIGARIPLGIVCTAGSDGKLTRYESFRDPSEALEAAGLS